MKTIMRTITIGREFGSGGREVGLKVATALNIPFYDKELISLAAEKGEMSPDFLEKYEESVAHAPFFLPRSGVFSAYQQPMTDKIYLSQFQIIQSLAAKGPCVIVGRSAGYVLKETALKVFIRADLSARVQRKLALGIDIPEDKMPQHIQAIDKKRSQYYQHYTDQIWGDVRNYNLCIDTTEIGTDGGSELIMCYLKQLGEIS